MWAIIIEKLRFFIVECIYEQCDEVCAKEKHFNVVCRDNECICEENVSDEAIDEYYDNFNDVKNNEDYMSDV